MNISITKSMSWLMRTSDVALLENDVHWRAGAYRNHGHCLSQKNIGVLRGIGRYVLFFLFLGELNIFSEQNWNRCIVERDRLHGSERAFQNEPLRAQWSWHAYGFTKNRAPKTVHLQCDQRSLKVSGQAPITQGLVWEMVTNIPNHFRVVHGGLR